MKRLALALAALLLLAAPAHATTWFMSTTGNDTTGNGTLGNPYLTISKVNSVVVAGDTVNMRAGTYHCGTCTINTSGTSGNNITWQSYPGDSPSVAILDGTGNTGAQEILVLNASFTVLQNFTIQNAPVGPCLDMYDSNHRQIINMTIQSCWRAGILVEDDNNTSHDDTILNNHITNASQSNSATPGQSGTWAQGISVHPGTGGTGYLVQGNTVQQTWGEGIGMVGVSGGTVKNNTVWDCFAVCLYNDSSSNVTWTQNLTYYTGDSRFINLSNSTEPEGIDASDELGAPTTVSGDTWTNNIVINARRCWRSFVQSTGIGVKNAIIENNTFVNCNIDSIQIDADAANSNIVVRNNINWRSPGITSLGAGSATSVTFDHNVWFGGNGGPFASGTGDLTSDPLLLLPGSRSALSLIDQAMAIGSFSSPARDTASSTSAPSVDYFGHPRPIGAGYDMGAIEFRAPARSLLGVD